MNSINPDRIAGQKRPRLKSWMNWRRAGLHLLPVGNAGNITAYGRAIRITTRRGRRTGARK